MTNWLKTNVAEITFWAGLYLIVTGWLNTPYWLDFVLGVLLISIDDTKAADWLKKRVPWLHNKIDQAGQA